MTPTFPPDSPRTVATQREPLWVACTTKKHRKVFYRVGCVRVYRRASIFCRTSEAATRQKTQWSEKCFCLQDLRPLLSDISRTCPQVGWEGQFM